MTQTPINIFDLLVADLNSATSGKSGNASTPTGEGSELFGDIFGLCLGQQNHVQSAAAGILGTPAADLINPQMVSDDSGTGVVADAATSEVAAKFANSIVAMLPQQMSPSNNIKDATANTPVDLEAGTYEILTSKIEDGVVSLTVAAKDNPQQVINLTLPADAFANSQTGLSRVSLDTPGFEQARLNALFANLNLKEIEVKAEQTVTSTANTTSASSEPVQITLFAETSAGEMALRGQLNRNRIRAFASTTQNDIPARDQAVSAPTRIATQAEQNTGEYLTGKQQILSGNARSDTTIGTKTLVAEPDLFEKFIGRDARTRAGHATENTQNTFGYDISQTASDKAESHSENRAMRITLPDDIRTSLKPNGKAVTISIEPEDLGPARLSLSLVNDKLKARIVVESAPAKAALESNLDRLVNQLSRAHITVDQIEISVSGNDAHNQFFGRQPHWRHRMTSRSLSADGLTLDDSPVDNVSPAPAAAQWVSAAGVNVLA